MLVPAVKQRAGNNLIMRLEMPGGVAGVGGQMPSFCRPQLAEPESCQRVSCLSPCFSLAPRSAAVRADGAGPWPQAAAGLGAHTPAFLPSPLISGLRLRVEMPTPAACPRREISLLSDLQAGSFPCTEQPGDPPLR